MTLLQFSFPINLNSFYVKIGEPLTKTSKLLTFSRPFSNLKCFPWNSFESKDSICCTNAKIKFYFFRSLYEILTRIELHVQRRTGRALYSFHPNKCILKSFKFLANSFDIQFTWTHCILMITF